jgi:small subunit ribosomal protein S2
MKIKNNLKIKDIIEVKTLLKNDVHLGCHKSSWNPKMTPFIYGIRQDQHLFDLNKTVFLLRQSLIVLTKILETEGQVLFIGHPIGYQRSFTNLLKIKNIPYLKSGSTIGGLLTNWQTHFLYRNSFLKYKKHKVSHGAASRFEKIFGNLSKLTKKPDLIIFFDVTENKGLVNEAIRIDIPIIAFLDTKDSPMNIDYPIPANTKSYKAGKLYFDLFSHIINNSKKIKA